MLKFTRIRWFASIILLLLIAVNFTGEGLALIAANAPDLKDNHGVILYDATNGVISRGDLMRFEKPR